MHFPCNSLKTLNICFWLFQDTQRKVYFHCYRGLFQNYCQHFKVKPSIIVAFNCGFSEFTQNYNSAPHITTCNSLVPLERTPSDTWYFGLIEMLQTYDTPIIFTSFTKQEANFDFSAWEKVSRQRLKINIERIFKTRNNPYRDIRPLRQWYVRDQESIYYRNNIIQAIRTKWIWYSL